MSTFTRRPYNEEEDKVFQVVKDVLHEAFVDDSNSIVKLVYSYLPNLHNFRFQIDDILLSDYAGQMVLEVFRDIPNCDALNLARVVMDYFLTDLELAYSIRSKDLWDIRKYESMRHYIDHPTLLQLFYEPSRYLVGCIRDAEKILHLWFLLEPQAIESVLIKPHASVLRGMKKDELLALLSQQYFDWTTMTHDEFNLCLHVYWLHYFTAILSSLYNKMVFHKVIKENSNFTVKEVEHIKHAVTRYQCYNGFKHYYRDVSPKNLRE